MFLWCGCHCANESESTFPPGSAFDASSVDGSLLSYSSGDPARPDPPTPVATCTACAFNVAPAAYEMEWFYGGEPGDIFQPRPCCSIYTSQTKYKLYFRGFDPGSPGKCQWSSNERVALSNSVACFANVQDAGARVTYQTDYANKLSILRIGYGFRYRETLPINHPQQTLLWSYVGYILMKDANTPHLLVDGNPIPCLQQLTLKGPWAIPGFGGQRIWGGTFRPPAGVWDGAPCRQNLFSGWDMGLPDSIVLRPVPA